MDIETGMQIGSKLFYLKNPALICGTIMPVFMLNAELLNAIFRRAMSNVIEDEHG